MRNQIFRLDALERRLRPRRRGTIHDALTAVLMQNFEYDIFPERQPANESTPTIDWNEVPANVWDNFWVDKRNAAECRAAWGQYQQSGFDPEVLETLRTLYADFRASDYCGLRKQS